MEELEYKFVDGTNTDFMKLCQELDQEYIDIYGEIALKYQKYNTLEDIHNVIVAYINKEPVGCGSYKRYDSITIELKRVYVRQQFRRKGIAETIIQNLEANAKTKGFKNSLLETGIDMKKAITLYQKLGYSFIESYGDFVADPICVCLQKTL